MILVTGATGTVGSALVPALQVAGADFRVLVRAPERADGLGVDAVIGDLADRDTLAAALAGVETLFLLSPAGGFELERAAVGVALEAGVRIVKLSSYNAEFAEAGIEGAHGEIERQIAAGGGRWTFLRPHAFMQNLLRQARSVARRGLIVEPMHGPLPRVDVRDVAAVAAHVLTEGEHDGRAYRISGPEALDEDAEAAVFSRALEREVRHAKPSDADAYNGMVAAGITGAAADAFVALNRWWREHPEHAEPVDTVERFAGRPPHTLEAFVREHRDAFGGADVTLVQNA